MTPQTSGRATIIPKRGYTHVGDIVLVDGVVHAQNLRRKVSSTVLQPAADRFWPVNALAEVRWEKSTEAHESVAAR